MDDINTIASLGDPVRRRLYDAVVAAPDGLTREQAAAQAGIGKPLAAYHLDRMVDDQLLSAGNRPRVGGPGAGRPAKVYRRAPRTIDVSLPPRRYDFLAAALLDVLRTATPEGESPNWEPGRAAGRELGRVARQRAGPRPSRTRLLAAAREVLNEVGYEAAPSDGGIVLRNCPYAELARDNIDLVCGLNEALLQGMTETLAAPLSARLDPAPDQCCVVLEATR